MHIREEKKIKTYKIYKNKNKIKNTKEP